MKSTDSLLTVKETPVFLKLNPLTVYEYIRSGRLKAVRFGRNLRILQADLENFITIHRTSGEVAV